MIYYVSIVVYANFIEKIWLKIVFCNTYLIKSKLEHLFYN
jgi:hypothetical protein